MKVQTLVLLLATGAAIVGFSLDSSDLNQTASSERGKILYEKYCSTCHGLDGKGEGTAAIYLYPKPRDFTRGLFKFQSTPSGSLPTDEDVLRTLQRGMPGTSMPAWDRLADQDRRDLVAFIKGFSEKFTTDKPPQPLAVEQEPPVTSEMIRKGKTIFALARCWMCHGKSGAGDGPSSKDLVDDLGRPITPYNFTRARAYKGGDSPQDIYRTFSTGVGGTPMPAYGEDALALGRESFGDLSDLRGSFYSAEIQEFKSSLKEWPTQAALDNMSVDERKKLADDRRWSLAYYVLSLSKSGKSSLSYTTTDHALVSTLVNDVSAFSDPSGNRWSEVKDVELALISLWQRDTPTDRVSVKVVSDRKSIAFRLEWEDATKDDGALHVSKFGDAVAAQFPMDIASDPFFGMGDTSFSVNIWQWKSWWEKDLTEYAGVNAAFPKNASDFYPFDVAGRPAVEYFVSKDSAKSLSMPWNAGWGSGNLLSAQSRKSPVEDLNARGFGTLASQGAGGQNVHGKGTWKDGKWTVVLTRTLATQESNDVALNSGGTTPVAFAVWDGSLEDRNGQKMVTNWYKLTITSKER